MVVESDESDGTFVKLPADIVVVTNIDPEHLDHYGTFDAMREAFRAFVENVPFYGFAVMCLDHPEVQALVARVEDRRIITYGRNPQAEVRFRDVEFRDGRMRFAVDRRDRVTGAMETIEDLAISMPGEHNVSNATAAVAVARAIEIDADAIRKGLASFGGVKRRFTHTGDWNGVAIYDDYGHHPVEIAAVLSAARSATSGRLVAVVQPHRYTRLKNLFAEFCTCFNEADTVIVAEVYPAGESPIEGASRDALVEGLRSGGHRDVRALEGEESLPALVASVVNPGDMVVCLGAGSITKWANALPKALEGLREGAKA
jgi:UDP-N-acetylmuramate--alanine ligase